MNKKNSGSERGFETRIVQAGRGKALTGRYVNPPVHRASTILFDSYAELREGVANLFDTLFYGRLGTPTQWSLGEAMTELEGGAGAWLYPSGMGAITSSLLSLLKTGDHLLMVDSVYEPARKFCRGLLQRMGIETTFYDPALGSDIEGLFRENTRVVFVESPGSLTMEIQDLPAIAAVAHAKGAYVIADNTWATPLFFNPLAYGADISVHAATKYIVGHSDAMLGVAIANERCWNKLRMASLSLGQIAGPDDAYLGQRGLRTLAPRLKTHQESGLAVARWLAGHPLVHQVLHPALEDAPGHKIWQRDFSGASGLFSVVLSAGKLEDIGSMVDQMEHFAMGFSWGGYESLILPADPAETRTAVPWVAPGPLLRLQIGLEDTDDLIADLDAGLARFQKTIS